MPANKDIKADMKFPKMGLAENTAFSAQPPETTPVGLNVRGYDPFENRDRGGSRCGISKYTPGTVAGDNIFIQDLNICPYTDGAAIGRSNYSVGGKDQTTLNFPGTYLLGREDNQGGYALSTTIAVDGNSNITVGTFIDGYPVGPDLQPLANPIVLPPSYFQVAFWQPGAFPLSQGDWQTGPQFPGFGYFADTLGPGTIDGNFGFPGANVPEFVGGGSFPDIPFWNWNSGYEYITIKINLGISRMFLTFDAVTVGAGGSITDANGQLISVPPGSVGTFTYSINNALLPKQTITQADMNDPSSSTGGAGNFDGFACKFNLYTDDTGPFGGPNIPYGTVINVPWAYLHLDPSPGTRLRLVVDLLQNGKFVDDPTFPATLCPLPLGIFNPSSDNNLTCTFTNSNYQYYQSQTTVLGFYRFSRFLQGWKLKALLQTSTGPGVNPVKFPGGAIGYLGSLGSFPGPGSFNLKYPSIDSGQLS